MAIRIDQSTQQHPWGLRLALAALFLIAMALLGVGIGEHTGVTGKDEYFLSLRTPLCMAEQNAWLVPCLDGQPRLKKPPMLYWLTRGAFEAFGSSLVSARLVAVAFAATLVLGVALIALELGAALGGALLAGGICLSFLSLFIGGRMLELDVPVAAFSTLAFYFLLRWYHRGHALAPVLAGTLLAGGFLTKGPVVFVVCGAGGLALLLLDPGARRFLATHRLHAIGVCALFAALTLPWFAYVNQLYPEQSGQALGEELAARHFFKLSPVPVYGFLMLTLPWGFIALGRIATAGSLDDAGRRRVLLPALWLGLSLLPFFFIRSFERYLYGSLVPTALLLALAPPPPALWLRWGARLGLLITLPLLLALYAAALWLAGPRPLLLLGLIPLLPFAYHWWQGRWPAHMALWAALSWTSVLGLAYPHLGINRIPPPILEQARGEPVVFFHGPQPGLLPAVLGRSLWKTDGRWELPEGLREDCAGFLLFVEDERAERAQQSARVQGLQLVELTRFGVLSSRVNWQHMTRQGVGWPELRRALRLRDLEPVMPRVVLYRVREERCATP